MGKRQNLDWGSIDWLYEPEEGSRDSMHIGLSRMNAGAVQPRHIHSGDEQFMYIISGHGRQKLGGIEQPLEPGATYHISAGTSHEAINDGEEDIVKLLVSVPARVDAPAPVKKEKAPEKKPAEASGALLRRAVSALDGEMLTPLLLPISIRDIEGKLVYRNGAYPAFCRGCCDIERDETACPLYLEKDVYQSPHYTEPSAFVCPYGLSVYVQSIVCEGLPIGTLRAGHVRTASPVKQAEDLPYNVPHSTVTGILQMMGQLCERICETYQYLTVEEDLQTSRQALSDKQQREAMLQSSLRTSQSQAANLQINQHFLFNTLNMIMSTAIREGAEQTYSAIGHLSQMLQYTLRTNSYFTPLKKELDYLKNYTALQKMRFAGRLTVTYHVDEALLGEMVPLNFLQPIVENCFKHAFSGQAQNMRVEITAQASETELTFTVRDNGCGMDEEQLSSLRALAVTGNAAHGTAMVMRKLDVLYGRQCRYDAQPNKNGTTITLTIPRERRASDETGFAGGR